jgi:hypothetical protein
MSKNIFIALVVIFLTTVLVFVLHSISSNEDFFANKKIKEQEKFATEENIVAEEIKTIKSNTEVGKLNKIVAGEEGSVKGAILDANTAQILYYQNRNFLLVDFKGQAKNSIGSYPFIDVNEVAWNKKRDKAIIRDRDEYFVYDINKKTVNKLDHKIDYVLWGENDLDDKLIYKSFDLETRERKIIIADSDSSNEEILVENLSHEKIDFKNPSDNNKICYHKYPDANFEAGLDCVDTKNKQIEILHRGFFAADYLWATNGNRILTSYVSEQIGNKMVLGVMNGKGGEFKSLNFPTTVEKCVWSKDNRKIYCAMMAFLEKDAILPNDWISGKYSSTDSFWEIDIESGKKRRLLESAEMIALDAEKLFLDENENFLFFTDKLSKSLYSISLR